MSDAYVVDISRNNGTVDMHTMRSMGIDGLIVRISNGDVIDDHAHTYYTAALAAGYDHDDICWYSFLNPKRGDAVKCARASLDAIEEITGQPCDTGFMLDCEEYINESGPQPPLTGAALADYYRLFISTIVRTVPAFSFGYTNRSYWNHPAQQGHTWVGDDVLAGQIEWIVARYPYYYDGQDVGHPVPRDPTLWRAYAEAAHAPPVGPVGAVSMPGWQFSAGFNHMGATYGAQGRDLDLNLIDRVAWDRWRRHTPITPTPPTPPPSEEPMDLYANSQDRPVPGVPGPNADGSWPAKNVRYTIDGGRLRHIPGAEATLRRLPAIQDGELRTNAELDAMPQWADPGAGGITHMSGPVDLVLDLNGGTAKGSAQLAAS